MGDAPSEVERCRIACPAEGCYQGDADALSTAAPRASRLESTLDARWCRSGWRTVQVPLQKRKASNKTCWLARLNGALEPRTVGRCATVPATDPRRRFG